jgi:ribonuclease HI
MTDWIGQDVIAKPNSLFTDGGVILKNTSPIGGTWAWCRTDALGQQVFQESGTKIFEPLTTNNQTELFAVVRAFEALPCDWVGTVHTDSAITLGRVHLSYKWTNIPKWMHKRYQQAVQRLTHFADFKYVLLKGHPTNVDLRNGQTKFGVPVSWHNVWCDRACKQAGEKFLAEARESISIEKRINDAKDAGYSERFL